jgi:hypothetical protein
MPAFQTIVALGLIAASTRSSGDGTAILILGLIFAAVWIPLWDWFWCYRRELNSDGTLEMRCLIRRIRTSASALKKVKQSGGARMSWLTLDRPRVDALVRGARTRRRG